MIDFVTEEQLGQKLAKVVCDGRHWVFVADMNGLRRLSDLEERHFSDEKSAAYSVYGLFPMLGVNVCTAEKTALSEDQLNAWLREQQESVLDAFVRAAHEKDGDILCLAEGERADQVRMLFIRWLTPYYDAIKGAAGGKRKKAKRRKKGHKQSPFLSPPGTRPADWTELRSEFRKRFLSDEFWMIVFDGHGRQAIQQIVNRHYTQANHLEDWILAFVESDSDRLGIVALRKHWMSATDYRRALTEFELVAEDMADHDIARSKCLLLCAPNLQELAERFAGDVLGGE